MEALRGIKTCSRSLRRKCLGRSGWDSGSVVLASPSIPCKDVYLMESGVVPVSQLETGKR